MGKRGRRRKLLEELKKEYALDENEEDSNTEEEETFINHSYIAQVVDDKIMDVRDNYYQDYRDLGLFEIKLFLVFLCSPDIDTYLDTKKKPGINSLSFANQIIYIAQLDKVYHSWKFKDIRKNEYYFAVLVDMYFRKNYTQRLNLTRNIGFLNEKIFKDKKHEIESQQ